MSKVDSASTLHAPHSLKLREKPLRFDQRQSVPVQRSGQPKPSKHIVQLAFILSAIFLTAMAVALGCFPELNGSIESGYATTAGSASPVRTEAGKPSLKQKAEQLNAMGVSLLGKDEEGAVACFKQAIDADPEFVAAYNNLGAALLQSGNRVDAKAAFASAVSHQPANVYATRQLENLARDKAR